MRNLRVSISSAAAEATLCCFLVSVLFWQVTDGGCDILTAREGESFMTWDEAAVQR